MKKILLTLLTSLVLFVGVQGTIVLGQSMPSSCIDSHNTDAFDACVGSGNYKVCSTTATATTPGISYCCPGNITCPSSTTPLTITGAGSGGTVTCADGKSINTAIGCIPINDQNALIGFLLRWGIGIGGGIAFLLILLAGFQIMTSRGDPNRLKAGQELMTSAISGLLLLIFSIVILRIIGVDILKITGLIGQ